MHMRNHRNPRCNRTHPLTDTRPPPPVPRSASPPPPCVRVPGIFESLDRVAHGVCIREGVVVVAKSAIMRDGTQV